MIPNIKRVLGSGFHWQTIVEDVDGEVWGGWFNSFTKVTDWRKIEK